MVVAYPSSSEGSVWSFLTITPFILFKVRGSIVPMLLPQLIFIEGLSVLAVLLVEKEREDGTESMISFGKVAEEGTKALAILVSFLLVLKTQAANAQHWEALSDLTNICHKLRSLCITVCGLVKWEKDPEVAKNAKRIVRLLVLYYFVVIEYFQRTGTHQANSATQMDCLRRDVASLAGDHEWTVLYPGEGKGITGSKSTHRHTRPTIILFWISLSLRRIGDFQATEPAVLNGAMMQLSAVSEFFWDMDKIDKTQFPFPYTQVVKWMTLVFLVMLPFVLAPNCGWLTLLFSAVATVGFFGLDEVAEILESPFGNDPNDLDLRFYADLLMSDLELICRCRDAELDFVFKSDEQIDFSNLMRNFDDGFHERFCTNLAHARRGLPAIASEKLVDTRRGIPATTSEAKLGELGAVAVLPGEPF